MPDCAFDAYVAVHMEDQALCDKVGAVRRRHYAATHKTYIGLRRNKSDAIERAATLFGDKCDVHKGSFLLLWVQFSVQGFAKYATATHGPEDSFAPTLHKITYPRDNSGTDYDVWAFHADLPLHETTKDGQVLISSTWHKIL
jgi:hypothetical protein